MGISIYTLLSGGQVSIGENHASISLSTGYDEAGSPLAVSWEEGRLWFVAHGQRIDITDRIDEETPYLYTSEDEAGNRTYIVVGGEPQSCGWMERWESADGVSAAEVYDSATGSGAGAGLAGQRPGTAGTHRIKRDEAARPVGAPPQLVKRSPPARSSCGRSRRNQTKSGHFQWHVHRK